MTQHPYDQNQNQNQYQPGPQTPPPAWGPSPAPKQAWTTGKKVGVGCGGLFGAFVLLSVIGAIAAPDRKEVPVPGPTVTVTETVPGPAVTVTAPAAAAATSAAPVPAPAPAQTTQAPAPAPAPATGTLPDFVGKQLQAAQDGAQAAGFYILSSTDATGAGRMQVLDRNWKVCAQTPKPGTHDLTSRVVFDTVKTEENCP
ncbi:hypothetical protein OHA37_38945 [Streptomyces sp. NBC_00335]|uniref:hypothetical protein n=1 Tax=unclassified Streptomyces TaxID=2593676 RepID=UPI00224F6FD1|nr:MULTISPECIES: hypothetical protein [unclassified Streptomyces]MCX5409812.1 hypothetical protein [Streptomyces sp. NBC_00086]